MRASLSKHTAPQHVTLILEHAEMEVSSAPYQFASFDQSNTSTSTDIGAMDVDMKDDMDIDIIGDAELLGMDNDATLQVSWRCLVQLRESTADSMA